jgi:hypothetical protein
MVVGVNHGGRGARVAPEFKVGDANANCPPDFVMFQNFKHQVACIAMESVAVRTQFIQGLNCPLFS